MILSFHPCFETDQNILCAGREPDTTDLSAIKSAHAVILPQGCRKTLFEMARQNCSHVFPDYNARFAYPGKIGQIALFRQTGVIHPKTETFQNLKQFHRQYNKIPNPPKLGYPFVFKFDWGGEGEYIALVDSQPKFQEMLQKAERFEASGHTGFLVQEYIPSKNRILRVAVIGRTIISYWRLHENTGGFGTSLAKGALIDHDAHSDLQASASTSVKHFCKETGINLAGFDFIFSSESISPAPLFLEINYFFGRRGLGGSEKYYKLLQAEIKKWIEDLGIGVQG
jgi:ribosomal protein S6--L-glutamate ligase